MDSINIIGDIHGRTCWKHIVREDSVNVFVGDYFDPYEPFPFEHLRQNFLDIVAYKESHPQTVLLYGNHDLHYICSSERCSRFDALHAGQYGVLLESAQALFSGAAFACEDALVTHAGVTKDWYERKFGEYKGETPAEVADKINALWQRDVEEFTFLANMSNPMDIYGEAPTHSPIWIRPWTLIEHNLFEDMPFKQVVGHTQVEDITQVDDALICVDCLGTTEKSLTME